MLDALLLVLAPILGAPLQAPGGGPAPTPAAQDEAPEPPPGLRVREPEAFDGLTLVSPLNSRFAYLIDMDGEVAHRWSLDSAPGGGFYLLEDGSLLRCGRKDENPRFRGGGIGGLVQRYGFEGELLWQYELADGQRTQHHDVEPLPNGNLLVIVWEHVPRAQVLAAGRHPRAIGEDGLWPDAVLEIRPEGTRGGEVVWEWRAWDHLVQDLDASRANHGIVADRPGRIDVNADHRDRPPETEAQRRRREQHEREMRALGYVGGDEPEREPEEGWKKPDWLHTNAVAYQAEFQLIALSTPHLSEVWVIDHSTTTEEARGSTGGRWGRGGDLLYRWGNPRTYGAGDDSARRLFRQHDPQWIAGETPGELRLIVFNNGPGRPGGERSSVDELVLPFDPRTGFSRAQGRPFGPDAPAWSYEDPGTFYSSFISGSQRLPNGNTLICQGRDGRVFEVTRGGRIVWDWWNPHGGDAPPTEQSGRAPTRALFRATRIPRDHPGLRDRLPSHGSRPAGSAPHVSEKE